LKILYAEDNADIASLTIETLEESFPQSNIIHVDNGKKAIDYLQCDVFDLVISDYTMPEKTGGDVLNYMLDNDREEAFILITGEKISILPEFKGKTPTDRMKFLNKPVDEDVLIELIARMLNISEPTESVEKTSHGEEDFSPIEITRLSNLNSAPCDIFLKINDKKMVKIVNQNGIETQDVVNKYQPKGIQTVFVKSSDREVINNALAERISKAMDLDDNVSTASKVALTGDAILTVQEKLINFGIDPEFVNHANKIVEHVLSTYSQVKSINELLKLIENSSSGYLVQHSMMTSLLANIILRNSEWNSVSNQEKITMASLFHDISITNGKFEELESKSFLVGLNEKNNEVPKEFKDHPQKSVELLSKIPNMPDLFTIILEHHEKPDGTGFPRGLKANRLSPMSCILILAHHATDLIHFNQSDQKLDAGIMSALSENYYEGHFIQLVESFKKTIL